ncbi:DUF4907 domain-containing protein [Chitinophaga alhagiae]|uniref:DUF4907 domain-containing protein n=1 Tax=Chitinophaga alhagiae TaxID=2203219 RepID=UPI0013007806|nr:DUF4907 domain-containing protein [Chitinophaga alhagiae]
MKMIKRFHRLVLFTVPPAALFFSCREKADTLRLAPVRTGNSWGYHIQHNGRPFIYQVEIPAVAGHHPFSSKEEAMRVGRLVLHKLRHGQSPAVSLRELDSLNVRPR